jgi:hypothetical protein
MLNERAMLIASAREDVRAQVDAAKNEIAVESRGGDLMVDEGPDGRTTQPDDPHFALPVRRADESVDRYVDQLERATGDVLLQPPRQ